MTPEALIEYCQKQIELRGTYALVRLSMPGTAAHTSIRRFPGNGPYGVVVSRDPYDPTRRIVIEWSAKLILDFIETQRLPDQTN